LLDVFEDEDFYRVSSHLLWRSCVSFHLLRSLRHCDGSRWECSVFMVGILTNFRVAQTSGPTGMLRKDVDSKN